MKRIVLLIAVLSVLCLGISVPVAWAEEEQNEPKNTPTYTIDSVQIELENEQQAEVNALEDTYPVAKREGESFVDYFRRVWLDKVLQYASVLVSSVMAVCLTVRKAKKAHDALVTDSQAMRQLQSALAESGKQFTKDADTYQTAVENMRQDVKALMDAERQLAQELQAAMVKLAALTQAVRIGFCNDKELVNNGFAAQIARVLEVQNETHA